MITSSNERTIGIIGGLGPHATVDFFNKLLTATPAESDQDHLHIIIENNPKVPNRHAAIKGTGPDAAPALAEMAMRLEQAGADLIVMACNTAHAFQRNIESVLGVPFISMIDEVVLEISNTYPDCSNVGIMAAEGCLGAELYQNKLLERGLTPIIWNVDEIELFMSMVYRIKRMDRSPEIASSLMELANSLVNRGAEIIVAGCTEIPLFLSAENFDMPFISSTDLLASRTVAYARGERALPNY